MGSEGWQPARFEPGEVGGREPGPLGRGLQGETTAPAQIAQAGRDTGQLIGCRVVRRIHASIGPNSFP